MKGSRVIVPGLFLVILAIVCISTFRPSPRFAEIDWVPERWAIWLDAHATFRHFIGFAFLSALAFAVNLDPVFNRSRRRFVRRFRSSRNRTGRLGALLVLVYLLEFSQLTMPQRDFDWLDIVNGWAAVVATWGVWFAFKTQQRRRRRLIHERRHDPINVSTVRFR